MRIWMLALVLVLAGCQSVAIVRGPNRNVSEVTIEIDYTTPQPPEASFLNAVKGAIENIVDPAVSVSLVVNDSTTGHGTWTEMDCREFALVHKDGGTACFYCIWANGILDGNPQAGGYSWNKRDFAVFPNVYGNNMGGLQIAFVHELLHCLGLVDKYLEMQTPHKHTAGNHCTSPSCIMAPAAYGSQPCPLCVADLEAGEEK